MVKNSVKSEVRIDQIYCCNDSLVVNEVREQCMEKFGTTSGGEGGEGAEESRNRSMMVTKIERKSKSLHEAIS